MTELIPRTLHYCWFGRRPEPAYVAESITSWRAAMPDFEVRRWDEDSWDPRQSTFSAAAAAARRWAFVSDVCRFDVLSRHGGVYLDTDVLALRSLEPFLVSDAFLGMFVSDSVGTAVIGSRPGGDLVTSLRRWYDDAPHDFTKANNRHVTQHLLTRYPEYVLADVDQRLSDGTLVLRKEYFERHTHDPAMGFTLHRGAGSWRGGDPDPDLVRRSVPRRLLGPVLAARLSNLVTVPRKPHFRVFLRHRLTLKRPHVIDVPAQLGTRATADRGGRR